MAMAHRVRRDGCKQVYDDDLRRRLAIGCRARLADR